MSSKTSLLLVSLMATVSILLSACVSPPEPPRVEQPPSPDTAQAPAQASIGEKQEPSANLPTPTGADVRNAVARMYKNAVLVDSDRFCVGDFNGDGIQDVAVVVRPSQGSLAELNSEVANWILEDPKKIVLPDPTRRTQVLSHSEPTRVEPSDTLLAILHGFGSAGWRDPGARQTYLLRNGAGANMKTQLLTDVLRTLQDNASIRLRGDVINESIAGEWGFLYYTGAKYGWYKSGGDKAATPKK